MRFGGIVLVTALLLGACSSDPEPVEPTRSSPPTPTVTPPAMPDQAREDSPEGAAAFVKHYVDVFNYAASTGDVEELSRLSSPDCDPCKKYSEEFQQIYDRGDRISAELWNMTSDDLRLMGQTSVDATINVDEGEMKVYQFRFRLSETEPKVVQSITILEPA